MRIVEYCWSFLNHSPGESHLSSRWFAWLRISLFNSCTIAFLRIFCHWSFMVGTHVGRGFPVILWAPDILQKPRGLCLGLANSSQEETDKTEKTWALSRKPRWGIHLFKTPHATLCHFDTLPCWLALEWGQAPELKRTMFELARSTAAFSVVLWGRGQYQMWDLFEHV